MNLPKPLYRKAPGKRGRRLYSTAEFPIRWFDFLPSFRLAPESGLRATAVRSPTTQKETLTFLEAETVFHLVPVDLAAIDQMLNAVVVADAGDGGVGRAAGEAGQKPGIAEGAVGVPVIGGVRSFHSDVVRSAVPIGGGDDQIGAAEALLRVAADAGDGIGSADSIAAGVGVLQKCRFRAEFIPAAT